LKMKQKKLKTKGSSDRKRQFAFRGRTSGEYNPRIDFRRPKSEVKREGEKLPQGVEGNKSEKGNATVVRFALLTGLRGQGENNSMPGETKKRMKKERLSGPRRLI